LKKLKIFVNKRKREQERDKREEEGLPNSDATQVTQKINYGREREREGK
jgi:hypothetical protein